MCGGSAGRMYDTGAFRELLSGLNSDRMNKSMPEMPEVLQTLSSCCCEIEEADDEAPIPFIHYSKGQLRLKSIKEVSDSSQSIRRNNIKSQRFKPNLGRSGYDSLGNKPQRLQK